MEFSLSQIIGLVSIAAVIVMALGFLAYISGKVSYIYRGSLRTAVIWVVVGLIAQTALLLLITVNG